MAQSNISSLNDYQFHNLPWYIYVYIYIYIYIYLFLYVTYASLAGHGNAFVQQSLLIYSMYCDIVYNTIIYPDTFYHIYVVCSSAWLITWVLGLTTVCINTTFYEFCDMEKHLLYLLTITPWNSE